MGITEVITARSPWQNAYTERVIGSIRRECLDHIVIFNEPPCAAPTLRVRVACLLIPSPERSDSESDELQKNIVRVEKIKGLCATMREKAPSLCVCKNDAKFSRSKTRTHATWDNYRGLCPTRIVIMLASVSTPGLALSTDSGDFFRLLGAAVESVIRHSWKPSAGSHRPPYPSES
jgi:hypothetical protein